MTVPPEEELEAAYWRILGVVSRQEMRALLAAAARYAAAEANAIIARRDELDTAARKARRPGGQPVMHWQVHKPQSGPACDPGSGKPCTTERGPVTCGACKQTPAWQEAAA